MAGGGSICRICHKMKKKNVPSKVMDMKEIANAVRLICKICHQGMIPFSELIIQFSPPLNEKKDDVVSYAYSYT